MVFRDHVEENPVSETILEKLDEALSRIDRPGSFCVSGRAPAVLPGLEVKGMGPVGLPVNETQAKELKKHCQQAPYGKGEQTIVDTSVRRVWMMKPDRFSLTNPDWTRFIEETVGKVQVELGLEKQKLESHLYDLLLYEPGSFFLPHRDGEKLDRMVATLVIVLPSSYEGGEIVVRHDFQERTIDFQGGESRPFDIHYAAFYADCEHEVRPLRKGHRLCLVYNLTLAKAKKSISAPRNSDHIETIAPLLRQWATEEEMEKLVITLEHQYTKDGLAWDALKGVDRARAQVLQEAARQADCRAYLGLLTFWESGAGEYADGGYGYGYGRRRRDYGDDDDDDDDDSEYVMDEVFDSSLTAENLSDAEGNALPIGTLHVERDELLDSEALTEVAPEEKFEGYTGNEGMTLERWYRHAAILIWPEFRHFAILCDRDSRDVVPVLKQMVAKLRPGKSADAVERKRQCIDLASAILARWTKNHHRRADTEEKTGDLLETLDALDEPRLIRAYLGNVLIKDADVDPGKSLVTVLQNAGWGTYQEELRAVMKGTAHETLERNVRLLEIFASARPRKKEGWSELGATLAEDLVSAIQAFDQKRQANDWIVREVDHADVLAGLARSLILTGQFDLLARVVTHALAPQRNYLLWGAHIPALMALGPWLKKHLKKPCAAMTRWVATCRAELESLTAEPPKEPADYRRKTPISCKCALCTELKEFLKNPKEPVHRFSIKEERRRHLEHEIRHHKCDLDVTTERKGSPHTLVCTKNKASYQEALTEYHELRQHLATIQAIEKSLPK
jgi:hypothetical protein